MFEPREDNILSSNGPIGLSIDLFCPMIFVKLKIITQRSFIQHETILVYNVQLCILTSTLTFFISIQGWKKPGFFGENSGSVGFLKNPGFFVKNPGFFGFYWVFYDLS